MGQREALQLRFVTMKKNRKVKNLSRKEEKCGKSVFRLVRERLERRRRAGKMKVPEPCEAACKAA